MTRFWTANLFAMRVATGGIYFSAVALTKASRHWPWGSTNLMGQYCSGGNSLHTPGRDSAQGRNPSHSLGQPSTCILNAIRGRPWEFGLERGVLPIGSAQVLMGREPLTSLQC